jgi:hypothetical protein
MMAPLVPEIVSSQFNFVIAFLLGLGFGFVLEQAGFSSTRKLVGLFYGYDFTVLKVFFTAGVTAMIGVLFLGHFGLLDLNLIYVNPTFLWSALIGGGIMGAGFIIGGFCPGTSVCAAAIGKVDAMAFIFGSLLGIFAFTEGFPLFENLYYAQAWGPVRINHFLGISMEFFGIILTMVALGAFYFTTRIENKVNGKATVFPKTTVMRYSLAGTIAILFIAVIWATPSHQELIQMRITEAKRQQKCVFKEIAADKLAYELVHNYYSINLIDVRSKEEYEQYHLPLAINIPLDEMMDRQWRTYFTQNQRTNIFYADIDTIAKMACLKARYIGDSENQILRESTNEFRAMFFQAEEPQSGSLKRERDIYRFRSKAARDMEALRERLKNINKPVKREIKKIQGGCS